MLNFTKVIKYFLNSLEGVRNLERDPTLNSRNFASCRITILERAAKRSVKKTNSSFRVVCATAISHTDANR
jgi:hypothetical protein